MTPDAPDWQPAEADEMRDVERPARTRDAIADYHGWPTQAECEADER